MPIGSIAAVLTAIVRAGVLGTAIARENTM